MRYLLLILFVLHLTACQLPVQRGEQAPAYMAVTAGSQLILTQAVTIPSNQASVYVQDGKITTYSGRDQYYPNCKFELYSMSDKRRTVKTDSFRMTRVLHDEDYVEARRPSYAGPLHYVPGNPMAIIYSVTFMLQSKQQPDVFRLTCQHWADPLTGEDLTLAEVRQTLQPLFLIEAEKSS